MEKDKINIVHFHNGLGGGVLSVICNLLAFSKNENICNHIIYTIDLERTAAYQPPELLGADSVQIFYYSQKDNFYYTCKQLSKLLPDNKAVIVAHDWLELGMVSNLGLQNPVVQIVHGDYEYYYELAKKHSSSIDSFITVAHSIEQKLQKIIPERKEDIKYLRFPVPENDCFMEKKDELFSIVFIGRCTKGKGYDLLPAISKALLDAGYEANWHIVGNADEKTQNQFPWPPEAEVNFHSLLSNQDVQKLLCRMHVMVLPSLAEGMPLSVIEAMKAGTIPLVNDIDGGIQELVSDGLTGFKITNNEVTSYKEKIIWLLKNPSEQLRIQTNIKEYATANFNPVENTIHYETEFLKAFTTTRKKNKEKTYGSRLDQVWLPNSVTSFIRNRS